MKRARIPVLLMALIVVACLFGPLVWREPPMDLAARLAPPGGSHIAGTDDLGRDVFARLLRGGRISLGVAAATVVLCTGMGTLLGLWSGWSGGWRDDLLMRVSDVAQAFPGMLLALALLVVMPRGPGSVVLALCVTGWVGYARLVRGLTLKEREMPYVEAARAMGAPLPRILFRHLLPNIAGPVLVQASLGTAGVILTEAGLSFLGLGIQPPAPSWGGMLRTGTEHLLDGPHLAIWPGLCIAAFVLLLNAIADGLSVRR